MVLGKGLVRRHGGVPEPDHSPSPHPPSAPNRAPAPTVPAAALPGSCSLHPQLSQKQTPTLVLPKDPQHRGHLLDQALPGSRMEQASTTRSWLLLHTFVHFAAAISGDSCTGRSSWQLSSEPAPPATRSGKAYIVQAARCRHNFDLGDLLVA